jgi:hypothetical protein
MRSRWAWLCVALFLLPLQASSELVFQVGAVIGQVGQCAGEWEQRALMQGLMQAWKASELLPLFVCDELGGLAWAAFEQYTLVYLYTLLAWQTCKVNCVPH